MVFWSFDLWLKCTVYKIAFFVCLSRIPISNYFTIIFDNRFRKGLMNNIQSCGIYWWDLETHTHVCTHAPSCTHARTHTHTGLPRHIQWTTQLLEHSLILSFSYLASTVRHYIWASLFKILWQSNQPLHLTSLGWQVKPHSQLTSLKWYILANGALQVIPLRWDRIPWL